MGYTNHSFDRYSLAQNLPIAFKITTKSKLLRQATKCQQSCTLLTSIIPPQASHVNPLQVLYVTQKCPAFAHPNAFCLVIFLFGTYQFYQTITVPLLLLSQLNASFNAVFKCFLLWELFPNSSRRNHLDLF